MTQKEYFEFKQLEKLFSETCSGIIKYIISKVKPESEKWDYRFIVYGEEEITFEMFKENSGMAEGAKFPIEWLWTEDWKKNFKTE